MFDGELCEWTGSLVCFYSAAGSSGQRATLVGWAAWAPLQGARRGGNIDLEVKVVGGKPTLGLGETNLTLHCREPDARNSYSR